MTSPSYIALIITILLLPWYVVRWRVAGVPTTLLEASIVLLTILWLAEHWRLLRRMAWRSVFGQYRWLAVFSGLFLLAASLAVLVSSAHLQALGLYKAYIVEPIIVAAVTISITNRQPRRWWGVLIALWLAGLEVVLVGLSQAVFGWPNVAPAELAQGRISSVYDTANAVGLFICPLLLIAGSVLLGRMVKVWQAVVLAMLVVLMTSVVWLSQSQGSQLALAISFALLLLAAAWRLWNRRPQLPGLGLLRNYGLVFVLVLYFVGSLGYVWWVNAPPKVANPYTRPGFSTLTVRQCLWQGTKGLLVEKPLLGSGLAGFSQDYVDHATCDAEPLVYPHMLALNFWVEMGVLGLVAVIGLVAWWGWQSCQIAMRHDQQAWLGLGLLLALMYWLLHGLVDVPYFKNDLSVEWWILVALVAALPSLTNTSVKEQ